MNTTELQKTIEKTWDARDTLTVTTRGEARDAVEAALEALDSGALRVAEKVGGEWQVHQWLKKAVLLSFRLNDMAEISGAPGGAAWWDKVPSKFAGWDESRFRTAGFRAVPGAIVRRSAHIAKGVVLMPSFVNIGAYVDEGTMVDTWATIGRRRAGALAGRTCDHRGPLLCRRAFGSRRRRRGRHRLGAFDGCVPRRIDQDRRPRHGRGDVWPRAALLGRRTGGIALLYRNGAAARLRRDRKARGRKDPLENLDQRIAAGLRRHLTVRTGQP